MTTSLANGPADASVPTRGRLLGFDYGHKRLGVSVCDPDQTIASPIENRTRQGIQADSRWIAQLLVEYRPVGLIVGLPVHLSGDEGGKAREAREFGKWLGELTKLPVGYADERYSSLIAEQHLLQAELTSKKRKARMDMLAAQIILQGYLDQADRTSPPGALPSLRS